MFVGVCVLFGGLQTLLRQVTSLSAFVAVHVRRLAAVQRYMAGLTTPETQENTSVLQYYTVPHTALTSVLQYYTVPHTALTSVLQYYTLYFTSVLQYYTLGL